MEKQENLITRIKKYYEFVSSMSTLYSTPPGTASFGTTEKPGLILDADRGNYTLKSQIRYNFEALKSSLETLFPEIEGKKTSDTELRRLGVFAKHLFGEIKKYDGVEKVLPSSANEDYIRNPNILATQIRLSLEEQLNTVYEMFPELEKPSEFKKIDQRKLSTRVRKVLNFYKITTFGDLQKVDRDTIRSMKGVGKKTVDEIDNLRHYPKEYRLATECNRGILFR